MSKPTIKPKDFKCYYNLEMQLIGSVQLHSQQAVHLISFTDDRGNKL